MRSRELVFSADALKEVLGYLFHSQHTTARFLGGLKQSKLKINVRLASIRDTVALFIRARTCTVDFNTD